MDRGTKGSTTKKSTAKKATAKKTTKKAPTATKRPTNGARAKKASPTQEDIARRAYELFIQRGYEHGHDMEDWLQAERDLNGR